MLLPASLLWILGVTTGNMVAALSGTCSSATLMRYASLYGYAPAHSYCSREYPNAASTPIVQTCNVDFPARTKRNDRHGSRIDHRSLDSEHSGEPDHKRNRRQHSTPVSQPSSSSFPSPREVLFTILLHEDETTISTFCSCRANPGFQIETIVCSAGEYCDTSGACKIQRDCQNPARCDVSSFCGTGSAGDSLFCHQDIDDATTGYCMNDGPPDASCPEPEQYEDCSSNAECGGQRVCIYSCCREEPFCIEVADYTSTVPSSQQTSASGDAT